MSELITNVLRERTATAGLHGATFRLSRSKPQLGYYLYRSEQPARQGHLLVSVHGISRNAEEHIELFRPYADRHRVNLLAPVFDADSFGDYQRLGRKGRGPRADLALIRLLNELQAQYGWDTSQVPLFGFSGGAQFVHRFAFAHPQRVRCMALGAAGWYTMPDNRLPYPHGIADSAGLEAVRFNPAAAARLRTLVMVGEQDDRNDDEELNRGSIVCKTQGEHRLQRARTWAHAMNALSMQGGGPGCVDMVTLPRVEHSFRDAVLEGGLATLLFDHCCAVQEPFWDRTDSLADAASHERP